VTPESHESEPAQQGGFFARVRDAFHGYPDRQPPEPPAEPASPAPQLGADTSKAILPRPPRAAELHSLPTAVIALETGAMTAALLAILTSLDAAWIVVISLISPIAIAGLAAALAWTFSSETGVSAYFMPGVLLGTAAFAVTIAVWTPLAWWAGALIGLGAWLGCAAVAGIAGSLVEDDGFPPFVASYIVYSSLVVAVATGVLSASRPGGVSWWLAVLLALVVLFVVITVEMASTWRLKGATAGRRP
jgi:hypothetical protein